MQKNLIGMSLALFLCFAHAQWTVNYNAALYEVGATYTNRTVDSAYFDPGPSGAGTWNFAVFDSGSESTFGAVAYSPSIPHIGDCAVTPNWLPYYSDTVETLITSGWGFYYVESTHIDPLGLYGTMTSTASGTTTELWMFNDSYTPLHGFPLHLGDTWTAIQVGTGRIHQGFINIDFDFQDTVYCRIDGYGSVTIPAGTFLSLRVRKRHTSHTHSDHILFGWDKTTRDFSFEWQTTEVGAAASFTGPKDSTGGQPDSTFTTGKISLQIYNSTLGVNDAVLPTETHIAAFPNPFNSSCQIAIVGDERAGPAKVEVYDIIGSRVWGLWSPVPITPTGSRVEGLGSKPYTLNPISCSVIWSPGDNIASGIYLIRATSPDGRLASRKIVYLK